VFVQCYYVAVRSTAIVSSLFPSNVRDRLFPVDQAPSGIEPTKHRLRSFLAGDGKAIDPSPGAGHGNDGSSPIADLFHDTTVLFSDISGFTAWSSVREPTQVFTLLENVYGAFDAIALKRGVFKVETIGDSYVAVTGLPEPRKDHAICMVKFARDCRKQMNELVRKLEVTLGPGTGDLTMRFGLHSGPVTAGVLRGQKSRFQLFGDTVNTASRMESTGIKGRIQASQATATLLIDGGMGSWVKPRESLIQAKGKGTMQTYWIEDNKVTSAAFVATSDKSDSHSNEGMARKPCSLRDIGIEKKNQVLIDWNTDVLGKIICQIMARRNNSKSCRVKKLDDTSTVHHHGKGQTVIDEVKEIIELPEFDVSNFRRPQDLDSIVLPPEVASQLRDYVETIATKYHSNPFHNFEHASHVGMSVAKLMIRIVTPDDQAAMNKSTLLTKNQALHDHTYGITSDPLTQFACVFAALVHDVDHPGVPNATLIRESAPVAIEYKGKSIAEQNSADIAWELLMEPKYEELLDAICLSESERIRFRQLVVNTIMATDIMDKDLKNLRNYRWEKAFAKADIQEDVLDNVNRKATIVIEHLIQASDIAHTMQHWHVYLKWNERLFNEMHEAYLAGRADKDPSEGWYQGELGFFDFYVIPLAKKLKDCGVFGVSSAEYLNCARENRAQWEEHGKDVVASMVAKLVSKC
jgi:class 3 adenylate cyclase